MKLESPAKILGTVRSSWWELLKAGWRLWPVVHIITYTVIPCQDRYHALAVLSTKGIAARCCQTLDAQTSSRCVRHPGCMAS